MLVTHVSRELKDSLSFDTHIKGVLMPMFMLMLGNGVELRRIGIHISMIARAIAPMP